jgi:hypothetical protein
MYIKQVICCMYNYSYEIAEKSLQHFEGNTTIECGHNLMRVTHKVSDHHLLYHE